MTKSPNGTRLTKGDYGYGVPMVAKPQETYSAVPWGTDPISQVMQHAMRPLTFEVAQTLFSCACVRACVRVFDDALGWKKISLAAAPPAQSKVGDRKHVFLTCGTSPSRQPSAAAAAAAAPPPAPQDDYYGQGQQQAQQGSTYYQQDAYAQSPYQNEGARGGYYPPPQHASEGGSSYTMGQQQQQQQHSYVQQPADGYHAPAASNGYYDEHKYQGGAAASVHSHSHSHQPSPAAPAASFGRRSAQRVEVILKEGQVGSAQLRGHSFIQQANQTANQQTVLPPWGVGCRNLCCGCTQQIYFFGEQLHQNSPCLDRRSITSLATRLRLRCSRPALGNFSGRAQRCVTGWRVVPNVGCLMSQIL